MLPDKCAVVESKRQCPNPPEFVVSITANGEEYMIGVTCDKHKQVVVAKTQKLQDEGRVPQGSIKFSRLKAVGTDCIHSEVDGNMFNDR